jgi:RHS repeat-associated protein
MVSSVTRTIGSRNYATSYQYTTAGQVTQLTYPSSRQLNINHDSIGRLSSIVNNGDSTNYLSGVGYNVAGQTTGWTLGGSYGGGIVESFGYSSSRLQLTSQTATQNGFTRLSLTYNYQASAGQMGAGSTAGNAGQLMSVSGQIGGTTESASYTYDLLGRLVTSNQTSNGASAQRRFVYDRWGNRTEVWDATSGGTQIQSVTLEQSGGAPTNRLTSVTNSGSTVNYSYDSAGNVTSDGVHSYGYDAENRLVSVDGGSTASYGYDHQNRRVKKVVGSTTTHYVWEGWQVIAEHNGSSGAVVSEYIFAGDRMIAREQSGRVFFLQDRLSIRATITDGQGNIQGRQGHLPFGDEFGTSGTQDKHRFSSYERDSERGTDYAARRVYGQDLGRFIQTDPLPPRMDNPALLGGIGDPQSLNRYGFGRNDPVNILDPTGGNLCHGYNVYLEVYNAVTGALVSTFFLGFIPTRCEVDRSNGSGQAPPGVRDFVPPLAGKAKQKTEKAINRARTLTSKKECDEALKSMGIDSLSAEVAKLEIGQVDASDLPSGNVFDGRTSVSPVKDDDGTTDITVKEYFNRHPTVTAVTTSERDGIIFLGPRFFSQSEYDRAITMLHEAVHRAGLKDTDFGATKDEGSRNLTELLKQKCK